MSVRFSLRTEITVRLSRTNAVQSQAYLITTTATARDGQGIIMHYKPLCGSRTGHRGCKAKSGFPRSADQYQARTIDGEGDVESAFQLDLPLHGNGSRPNASELQEMGEKNWNRS